MLQYMSQGTSHGRSTTIVALGTAQTLAWGSTYYLPAVLGAPMAEGLGLPLPYVFGAFSAGLVVSALLGPAAGRIIDRQGGRGVLAMSNIVFAAGLALLAAAQGVGLLTLGWLVIGVGMAFGLYDAAFAALAKLYGEHARGPITGITLIAGFASTVGWPISAYLEAEFGWRTACLVWAVLHLVLGMPLNGLLVPRAEPFIEPPAATVPDPIQPGPGPSQTRTMFLLAFIFAATWFVSSAMSAHLPLLLQLAGVAPAAAIAAAALVGPAQVLARLAEFGFLRRFHPLVSARLAATAHPLGTLVLLAFGGPAAAVFTALYGAGNGLLTIAKGTLPLALFGPAGYGLRQGLLGAPSRFVQAGAPFAFGLILETYGVMGALAVSSGLSMAAFVALLLIRANTEHR
jgi:MFS family permease